MNPDPPIDKRKSIFLPHWERAGATYAVTFRLADSLPVHAVERLAAERRQLERELMATGGLDADGASRLDELMSDRVEEWLHAAHGSCVFRNEKTAQIVADALRHFDGERYVLDALCVMPNHVHVVFKPHEELAKVLHSWKSFTAKQINKVLAKTGSVWQADYYNHLVRGESDWVRCVRYVLNNPTKAKLSHWKWVYLRDGIDRASLDRGKPC